MPVILLVQWICSVIVAVLVNVSRVWLEISVTGVRAGITVWIGMDAVAVLVMKRGRFWMRIIEPIVTHLQNVFYETNNESFWHNRMA